MLALIKNDNEFLQTVSSSRLDFDTFNIMSPTAGLIFGEDREFSIVEVVKDTIPEGHRILISKIERVSGVWTEVHTTEKIPELTPEEIRQNMPQLSMVDFRRKLRGIKVVERENETEPDGIYEEDILEKIAIISDKELQAEARDYFMFAQYIERINPWVEILGGMFGITPEEIDAFWLG